MVAPSSIAQTDGTVQLNATINDYPGNGDDHWTVVWVTSASGTFIKTLWKQGPSSMTSSHWNSHCRTWYRAKNDTANGGNNVLDGYSSGSAKNYTSSANNPIDPEWDCRDKDNDLVPDGDYKFWIQYAEDDGQGPYTTNGLTWTKGPAAASPRYPNQGSNFSSMSVTWTPVTVAPTITSTAPPATGTVGVPYDHTCAATGTTPVTFSATGLPTGLSISSSGEISGIPEEAGLFNGTITAANGTAPNATQAFSIEIIEVPVLVSTVQVLGGDFMMGGEGPPNGSYTLLSTTNPALPLASWTEVTTGTFNGAGQFLITRPMTPGVSALYYRFRIP
jgi:hypothetical protein